MIRSVAERRVLMLKMSEGIVFRLSGFHQTVIVVGVVFVAVVPWCRNRRQCKRDSFRNATMSQVLGRSLRTAVCRRVPGQTWLNFLSSLSK